DPAARGRAPREYGRGIRPRQTNRFRGRHRPARSLFAENRSRRGPCGSRGSGSEAIMDEWSDVHGWRQAERKRLLAERRALRRSVRRACAAAVAQLLAEHAPPLDGARIGFYWPIKGEIDLVGFVRSALPKADAAALPVVVERWRPLEFWRWTARTELVAHGIWNIPSPPERVLVQPDVVLVPLLGFDRAGYRLGYGGGYYDRTLDAMASRPICVGVGHDLGRLDTIHPQPHDIPMDMIVTESGVVRCR
ncbi:MAG: 5-formyltetrahydrofolate cyclo-ligase, partial [Gammaproteobacteria bacterium]|nr:5-formyltetrahydrofolate cyclo-ligase [Gammaproteobacteria bacterium]